MLEFALMSVLMSASIESMGFAQAVQESLAKHPAVRMAEQDVARALAQVEQARAASLPSLSASGTFTRLDDDRRLGDRLVLGKEQLSANLQLSVPLVNTPKWAQWYRAAGLSDVAQASSDELKRQVALSAARAWLAVLAQQRVLSAAQVARDTAQAHFTFARERLAGGVGTRLDELRAAQELSQSDVQVETAAGALVRAQELLGLAVGADAPVDAKGEEPPFEAAPTEGQGQSEAEQNRLDVKAARSRQETAQAATRTGWMDYAPLLSAVFQPFSQNPPSLTQPLWGWQLNVVLHLPIYDGGLRYGQAKERRASELTANAQLELALRQAKSEVRSAWGQLAAADRALKSAREAEQQANDALTLANVAYSAGATTNLEVIDAERRARDAALQAVVAEDRARQARLELLVASGRFP